MLKYRVKGKLCTKEKYDAHQIRLANLEKGRVPTVKTSTPKEASKRSLSTCEEWEDVPTPKTPKRSCEEQENIIEDEEDVDEVEDASEKEFVVRGRRIFEPWENFKQMWCCKCKEALNGQYTEKEERRGLGCIWWIRCHKCSVINIVTSGKMHAGAGERASLFDVNAKAVMGVTSAGCSYAHFNALISTLNMPNMDRKTFKRYERKEVGPSLEKVAKQSCEEAAREERELTIRNKTMIEQIL
ncbi:hypothetical protein FOCC_FOCC002735 [Frankliniella occidentalis]|nr:hypothetical protein FOCC_FOCC002735 [Frankliniella occidentalis]